MRTFLIVALVVLMLTLGVPTIYFSQRAFTQVSYRPMVKHLSRHQRQLLLIMTVLLLFGIAAGAVVGYLHGSYGGEMLGVMIVGGPLIIVWIGGVSHLEHQAAQATTTRTDHHRDAA